MTHPLLSETIYPHESRIILVGVQAVDHTLAGGAWQENTFDLNPDIEYLELTNNAVMATDDLLAWELSQVDELDGFDLQIALGPDFDPVLLEQWILFDDPPPVRELYTGITLNDLDSLHLIQQDIPHYWRIRPFYTDPQRTTVFSEIPGEFILVEPPAPPQQLQITVDSGVVSLSWEAVPGNLVYYVIYSSTDALAPFPAGWQVESPPTLETAWQDLEPAGENKFYRVKAVVVGY